MVIRLTDDKCESDIMALFEKAHECEKELAIYILSRLWNSQR